MKQTSSTAHKGMNRQIVLARRPETVVDETTFELREAPIPAPTDGRALVRNLYLSLDPAQRAFLNAAPAWGPPMSPGDVMRGVAIAQVIESRHPDFAVGELVEGWFGWQDYAVVGPRQLGPIGHVPADVAPADALSVLGLTGLTAYFGVIEVGRPRAGQTMLVSAAAGATGSVAGQVARVLGCRVIGIAGGPEKCAWLVEEARFDATIDHRHDDVPGRLRELMPDGVELFFDNVGGDLLDTVLGHLAYDATIVVCGSVSSGYTDSDRLPPGPRNYVQLSARSARMEGYTLNDFTDRFDAGLAELRRWLDAGELRRAHDVLDGIEQAPAGLRRLFEGANLGKAMVRIADPET